MALISMNNNLFLSFKHGIRASRILATTHHPLTTSNLVKPKKKTLALLLPPWPLSARVATYVAALLLVALPPLHNRPLDGRMAIITGASRGIGRAIAMLLTSLGACLVLNYASSSSSTHVDLLATELNSSSSSTPRTVAVRANISDPANVKSLFDRAESFFDTAPHILVACTGMIDSKYPSLANTAIEDWDAIFAANARGAFLYCREAANRVQRGDDGRIITVSSSLVGALRPGCMAYMTSKAVVEAMTRILAKELKGTGCLRW